MSGRIVLTKYTHLLQDDLIKHNKENERYKHKRTKSRP